MQNEDKYIIATAIIDGRQEDFYRKGEKEGFYLSRTYSECEIRGLQSDIHKFRSRISNSFKRVGYIYSDAYTFFSNQIPEVLIRLLEKELNINISACGQGSDFIIFSSDVIDFSKARNCYNEHFGGTL